MDKNIVILAASRLGSELCVAGVDDNRNWIRPTTLSKGEWWEFCKSDIYDKNSRPVVALSNTVAIHLIRQIPHIGSTPHIEDWEYNRSHKPILKEKLSDSQRLHLFQRISEPSLEPLIENHERSLCLIKPSSIISADFANTSFRGVYQPILSFIFNGKPYRYKVTDIYWRAIGRDLLARGHGPILDGAELHDILQYSKLFLTIGLARFYKGEYWPMVVGVHTVPEFPVTIDYDNT